MMKHEKPYVVKRLQHDLLRPVQHLRNARRGASRPLRWTMLLVWIALAACSSTPPQPDWQINAKGALERAQEAYLSGNTRVETAEFAKARSEVASTGRADLMARIELARCATRVASLVFEDCVGFTALAQDAPATERAYAAYLAGRAQPSEAALLPEQHRAAGEESGLHFNNPRICLSYTSS